VSRPADPRAPQTVSPDEELAVRLRVALARIVRRLRAVAGEGDLTASQLSALATLDAEGALRVGDLAARESVAAPTMTRLAGSLVKAGLVRRLEDPADRRSAILSLTRTGVARLRAIGQERTIFLAARVARLPAADRRRLRAALPLLEELAVDDAQAGSTRSSARR
jgi:DNA-binding MarR family transcriptional regulator